VEAADGEEDGVSAARLTKLPNGTWLDMTTVVAVRMLPAVREAGRGVMLHQARVVVVYGEGGHEVILANNDEHAEAIAEDLANDVNEACGAFGKEVP
jgi:ArsR family metal-binding transcriptional regulator